MDAMGRGRTERSRRERGLVARLVLGAGCGLAATGVMTAWLLGWQRCLGGGRLGPAVVTDRTLRAVRLEPERPAARVAVEGVAHFGFGTGLGAAYAALSPLLLKRAPAVAALAAPLRGAVFAVGIWSVTYGAAIPALGLVPPPGRDQPGRQPRLVTAHLVYGATLGALLRRGGS
jgi:hypothetical protein